MKDARVLFLLTFAACLLIALTALAQTAAVQRAGDGPSTLVTVTCDGLSVVAPASAQAGRLASRGHRSVSPDTEHGPTMDPDGTPASTAAPAMGQGPTLL